MFDTKAEESNGRGELHNYHVRGAHNWVVDADILIVHRKLMSLSSKHVELPYSNTAKPIGTLDVYVVEGQLYFHVLCVDLVVPDRVLKIQAPHLYCSYFRKHATL